MTSPHSAQPPQPPTDSESTERPQSRSSLSGSAATPTSGHKARGLLTVPTKPASELDPAPAPSSSPGGLLGRSFPGVRADLRGVLVGALVLVGFALVSYGVGMFSPAAGVITAGVLLVVFALVALAELPGGSS